MVNECKTIPQNVQIPKPTKPNNEMVDHPKHYNMGAFEVIDVIEDWGLNFKMGSAVKYIARADHKGNKIQDLQKAIWFLKREIEKGGKDES